VEFGSFLKKRRKKKRFVPRNTIKKRINRSCEDDLGGETIQQAKVLEGNQEYWYSRCGVIITPSDTNFVPVAKVRFDL
jgi:DNA polymerase-3 subunit alpha